MQPFAQWVIDVSFSMRPILAARSRYPQVAATGVVPIHDPGKVVRLQQ